MRGRVSWYERGVAARGALRWAARATRVRMRGAGAGQRLVLKADARGHFVETVRCRGGEGQTSFSTTVSGVTRGIHYHLHKIERFAVIQGRARISLRRLFHDEIVDVHVTGDEPVAVDMPVGWAHDITNTGDDLLLTQFWSHELFRPYAPDTYPEPVRSDRTKEISE